jgi:hypothetical protein
MPIGTSLDVFHATTPGIEIVCVMAAASASPRRNSVSVTSAELPSGITRYTRAVEADSVSIARLRASRLEIGAAVRTFNRYGAAESTETRALMIGSPSASRSEYHGADDESSATTSCRSSICASPGSESSIARSGPGSIATWTVAALPLALPVALPASALPAEPAPAPLPIATRVGPIGSSEAWSI